VTPSRALHSDITTELAKGAFTFVHLVKITLGTVATPVSYYYTNSTIDIVEDSDTYTANGFLLGMDSVSEDTTMSTGSLTLEISAVNQTIVSDILTNGYIHRPVVIKRAFLNSSNSLISANAVFTIYDGRIEGMSIIDNVKTSTIKFRVANHWAFFARIAGRRTTNESQQHFYPDDLGFSFMGVSNK